MIYKKMATRAALLTLLSTSTLLGDAITPCYTTDWTTPHLPQWVKYIPILTQKERILCLEVGSYEGRSTTWIAKNFATQQESKVLAIDPMGAYYGYEEGGPRACEPTMYETFMNNTKDLRDAGKIFLIREPSQTAWSMIFDGARGVKGGKARGVKVDEVRGVRVDEVRRLRFDEVRGIRTGIPDVYFIFLDGEHAGPTAIEDLVAAWDVLQPGGILVIDDYELASQAFDPLNQKLLNAWETYFDDPDSFNDYTWVSPLKGKDSPKVAIDLFLAAYKGQYTLLHKAYQIHIQKLDPVTDAGSIP